MNGVIKNFSKKINASFFVMLGIFCVIVGFLAFIYWQKSALSPEKILSCLSIVDKKYTADAPCLERVVNELMAVYSTTDLLQYIAAPSTPVVARVYSHAIAHFIGERTFLKTGSVELSIDQCTPDSEYGCMHGAIAAAVVKDLGVSQAEAENLPHANPTTIESVAKKYCTSNNMQMCHALGHILFQISPDYSKILTTCKNASIKNSNKKEACSRGVFMESASPVGSFAPNKNLPASNLTYQGVCGQISPPYQHACFRYLPRTQLFLFQRNRVSNAHERLAISKAVCGDLAGPPRADCIESIGLNAKRVFADDTYSNKQNFCDQFNTGADRQACVLGVIGSFFDIFDYNRAVSYCTAITDPALQNFCYHALFRVAEQISMGSAEILGQAMAVICDQESTSKQCNQKLNEYLTVKSALPNYILGLYGER